MKRNWDTIRTILIKLEDRTVTSSPLTLSSFDESDNASISYHVQLLNEANLIEASISERIGPGVTNFSARRMTWNGHELLDAISNDTIWNKTKKVFTGKSVSMTFDILKTVATSIMTDTLK